MSRKQSKNSRGPTGTHAKPSNSNAVDVDLLERLVKLMTTNDLNTVDVRDGTRRVVLKRGAVVAPAAYSGFPTSQPHHVAPSGAHHASAGSNPTPAATDIDKNLAAIKSPMVGTYYSSPSPDAPPFVSVGSEIDEDTEVCIIEAMKVFNTIKAECRGSIERILVTNGQTVEFGQVLFLVKPA